jgi:hypothetical protein
MYIQGQLNLISLLLQEKAKGLFMELVLVTTHTPTKAKRKQFTKDIGSITQL